MGLLKRDKEKKEKEEAVKPWMLEGGWYLAEIHKIELEKSDKGDGDVFCFHMQIRGDISTTSCASKEAPPLYDIPVVKLLLDSNDTEQAETLFCLIGKPFDSGRGRMAWGPFEDENGNEVQPMFGWNGATGVGGRYTGQVEMLIRPTRAARMGKGLDGKPRVWPAEYLIEDFERLGAYAEKSNMAAAMLLERYGRKVREVREDRKEEDKKEEKKEEKKEPKRTKVG